MNNLFLNPDQALSTCASKDCQICPLQKTLQCHFRGKDLARFFLIAFPPFILGGIGISKRNVWMLIPWIALCLSYFGLIEIKVMCSHCPHYAEPEINTLKCWANYGSPKLWKYQPGPMTEGEQFIFFAGLVAIAGYPFTFLIIGSQWILLIIFILTVSGMAFFMSRLMCSRCMNFACPFNHVDQNTRKAFFKRNPTIARTWKTNKE